MDGQVETPNASDDRKKRGRLARALAAPVLDLWHGLDRCLERGFPGLGLVVLGLALGWWIYVPIHELFHAFGCFATGGTLSRLEIDPKYGGALLEEVFPFVAAGSDYAGQLTGFDTHGNDLIYLATVFAPFLLTLFPGVWAHRRSIRARAPFGFGFWIAFAFAPFVSLTGDAYEIGSIVTARFPPWSGEARELLVGDDLFLVAQGLGEAGLGAGAWLGFGLATILGIVWAFATWHAGRWIASRFASERDRTEH